MRMILLGPPGAGKDTQAHKISQQFSVPVIATGEMLREAVASGSELGRAVEAVISRGELVDDATMIQLVNTRLQQKDCNKGFIFNGFPRTLAQAEALRDEAVAIDWVINLKVDDEQIVERISGRLTDPESGRVYHRVYHPPKVMGKDDISGCVLVQRDDDREDTVRRRLAVYREQTEPLLAFYAEHAQQSNDAMIFCEIDGHQSVAEVTQAIFAVMEQSHEHN